MKKVFAFIAIAAVMTACNNSGEGTETTDTATAPSSTETSEANSTHEHAADTTATMPADTIKK